MATATSEHHHVALCNPSSVHPQKHSSILFLLITCQLNLTNSQEWFVALLTALMKLLKPHHHMCANPASGDALLVRQQSLPWGLLWSNLARGTRATEQKKERILETISY